MRLKSNEAKFHIASTASVTETGTIRYDKSTSDDDDVEKNQLSVDAARSLSIGKLIRFLLFIRDLDLDESI